jgi:uncharacterized protein YaiE (UPF0345 family)/N-acetylglutamate synthase-like GNAT family acetyltransferase
VKNAFESQWEAGAPLSEGVLEACNGDLKNTFYFNNIEMMNTETSWVRFEWNFAGFQERETQLPQGYNMRTATIADAGAVLASVLEAYGSDKVWKRELNNITIRMTERIYSTIGQPECEYLVIEFQDKIVGVSGISQLHWTRQNLLTGICVTSEHQKKGLGRYLLYHSLLRLKGKGLPFAAVYTERGSVADEKIYPLFDSKRVENVKYLQACNEDKNPIVRNFYFQGRVQSLGIDTEPKATIGLIKPGCYTFFASNEEHVRVISGDLMVVRPGEIAREYKAGDIYIVKEKTYFNVSCDKDVAYFCEFISQ